MPKLYKVVSDISGKELKPEEIVHISKGFGYCSDFDLGKLSVYTTKEELEKLFDKKITENSEALKCFCCEKDIIEECKKDENKM